MGLFDFFWRKAPEPRGPHLAPFLQKKFEPPPGPEPKRLLMPKNASIDSKGIPVLSIPVQQFFNMMPENVEDQPVRTSTAYKLYALVYACMRYRATKLTEAPLWIYEEKGTDDETVVDDYPDWNDRIPT
jgi:hypothetical protein